VSIVVAIVGLGLLILVHELGHFVVALSVGLRPRKFYVGFPPAVAKTTRNGIEYGIGAIPLGGFVKIPGMHRPAPSDVDVHFRRALDEAPGLVGPLERLRRLLGAGDFDAARGALDELAAAVGRVRLSTPAATAATKGLAELGDALGPEAYWRARTWKRVAAIVAGPGANVLLAVLLFAGLFMAGGGKATSTIDEVVQGTPAERAGLRSGDRIVAIDGAPVQASHISQRIADSGGKPLVLRVKRDGRELTLPPAAPVATEGRYRLGFRLRGEGLSAPEASWQAVRLTGVVTKEIGAALGRLVTGEGRKDIAIPVGIVQGSSSAAQQGVESYLWVLGLISLSLALLNLLPLLPLDGGHIAFSLIEGVRGRSVGREIYERVSAVGIALVLILFFIGLSNDIGRLGGG
jgi:regulator of sigma E protease